MLLGVQLSLWLFLPIQFGRHADFRSFYVAGYMVRSQHAGQLYDYGSNKTFQDALVSPEAVALAFNHPAYEALIYLPFSLLGYSAAYFAFLAVNLVFLGFVVHLLHPYFAPLAPLGGPVPVAMFLCFIPIGVALLEGQDSILLLLLCTLGLGRLRYGRDFSAGVLVGLGLFKFQIVLPMALLFLAWKRWRFTAGFAVSSAVCAALSWWLVGSSQLHAYAHSLVSMSVGLASHFEQSKYGILPAMMPNLRGLIFGLAGGRVSMLWMQGMTIALSVLALLWAARREPRSGTDALLLAIAASAVVSYHMLIHDLSIMLIPIGVTLSRSLEGREVGSSRRALAASAALVFVTPAALSLLGRKYFYLAALPLLAFLFASVRSLGKVKMEI